MSLLYAKIRLCEWGRWGRDKSLGYPRASAGFSEVSRTPAIVSQWPLHIQQMDCIVRSADQDLRRVLIVHYTQTGTGRDKALRIEMDKSTYFDCLDRGQWYVGIELDYGSFDPITLTGLQSPDTTIKFGVR